MMFAVHLVAIWFLSCALLVILLDIAGEARERDA